MKYIIETVATNFLVISEEEFKKYFKQLQELGLDVILNFSNLNYKVFILYLEIKNNIIIGSSFEEGSIGSCYEKGLLKFEDGEYIHSNTYDEPKAGRLKNIKIEMTKELHDFLGTL